MFRKYPISAASKQAGFGALIFSILLTLISVISAPQADAAAGTVTNGNCSSVVGETTTVSIVQSGNDCILTFTSGSNSWTAPTNITVARVLVVGGGAGGDRGVCGVYWGHGGGGGQVQDLNLNVTPGASNSISIGAGGSPSGSCSSNTSGTNGGDSTFGSVFSGGGKAANYNSAIGGNSGLNLFVGGTGTGTYGAGGGAGAGGAGSGINGGTGINSDISGSTVMYGSGGAGKNDAGFGSAYSGGGLNSNGTANRGGGGSDLYPYSTGSNGGSGVVIVRYKNVVACTPTSTTVGSATVLQFTTVGACNWTVPSGINSVRVLLVGGGGGGGSWVGGGGGGGGVLEISGVTVTPGATNVISVAAGGYGSITTNQNIIKAGVNGGDTTALGYTGYGGGLGANYTSYATGSRATSGGAAHASAGTNGINVAVSASVTPWQGYAGGTATGNSAYGWPTGGGGGAGGLGGNATTSASGVGGTGRYSNITGTASYYGGGGGGGCHGNGTYACTVGTGTNGGGNGVGYTGTNYIIKTGGSGTANTGGGGGGSGGPSTNAVYYNSQGGNGGSGIVIIRYESVAPAAPTIDSVTSGAGSLIVSWTAPTDKRNSTITGYQVDYSTTGLTGSWTTASSSVASNVTSYSISGLSASTEYYVRVAATYSGGVGAFGYPWTKIYSTSTPYRTSGLITYDSGFGLSGGAATTYSSANFSRIRYYMTATYNGVAKYVDADFYRDFARNTSTSTTYDTISKLQVPTTSGSGSQFVLQGNVSDLNIRSNASDLASGNSLSGRIEIWERDYGVAAASDQTARTTNTYDDSDAVGSVGSTYGSFQLHNMTSGNKETVFAWNNHGSSSSYDLGFGSALSGNTDWTFCARDSICTGRSNFTLVTYVNIPTSTNHTITYAAAGGTGSDPVSPTSVAPNSTFTIPANTYTRSGYTFAGWSDGSATYQAGETYPSTGSVSATLTLTATWTASLLAYESFDTSSSSITGYAGGTGSSGFSGNWSAVNSVNDASASSTGMVIGNPDTYYRHVYPAGVGFAIAKTNKTASMGGGTKFQQNARQLSSAISMDANKDYYLSYLMADTSNDTQVMAGLMSGLPSSTSDTSKNSLLIGYGKDAGTKGQFAIDYGSANRSATCPDNAAVSCTSTPTYTAKTSLSGGYSGFVTSGTGNYFYFVLAKITSVSSGNDTVKLKTYSIGSSIPTDDTSISWDLTYSAAITGSFTHLTSQLYGSGYQYIDEIRLTTSYEAAVNPTTTKTLTLDANYVGGSTATQVVSTSVETSVANPFTRTGYTFAGWNTDTDGTSGTNYAATLAFSTTDQVNVSADTTLYAKWTANTYAVTLGTMTRVSGDTTSTISISPSSPIAYGSTVTLTASPAADMRLKAGTLVATYNTSSTATISGSSPYTFTMPAYAVTITAEFESAETAPGAPTINSISVSSTQLSVAFTEGTNSGSSITKYQYSTDGGSNWKDRATGTTASPLVITTVSDSSSSLVNGTTYSVKIRAFNTIAGTASSAVSATPYAAPTLAAPTSGLTGTAMVAYSLTIPAASGGSGTYTYSITAGSLPAGLSLSNRTISGTPTAFGTFSGIRITATDSSSLLTGQSSTFTITINSGTQLPLSIATIFGTVGQPVVLVTSGGSGSGGVTYSYRNGSNTSCSLAGSVLTASTVGGVSGFCYLTATKAADNAYTQTASRETIVVFTAYVPVITQGTTCTPTNTGTNATGIGTNSCQPIAPVAPTAPVGTGAPKITSLSATNGLVGASITITGTGFASVTKVQFGAKSTTTFTATATTITVNIPTGATTGRVMVFSPTGTAMASQIFTVTQLDTRAPSFVSGNVNTSVPAQITLNFDETLAATSLATSAISISVASIPRSINSLVISATTITLTLSSSVTAGQTVEFTYTSPDDSTAIQDAAGNKTATITATALTNTL